MKKLFIGALLLSSNMLLASDLTVFSNSEGCTVEKEVRNNGTLLFISKGDKREVVGYANDFISFGDFVYCADEKTQINSFVGSKGTRILIACSEHKNENAVTRGRVDISLDTQGNPVEVKIDGQRKGLFSWKKDTNVECANLVQE